MIKNYLKNLYKGIEDRVMNRLNDKLDNIKNDMVAENWRIYNHSQFQAPAIDAAYLIRMDAVRESADFIKQHLHTALILENTQPVENFWRSALSKAPADGYFMEFGVFEGFSLQTFAKMRPEATFYGFDSFEGLPEDWAGSHYHQGYFSLNGEMPNLDTTNIQLVKGLFQNSLPDFIKQHFTQATSKPTGTQVPFISFVHMDADLYSSTQYVLEQLRPYFIEGSIIVFDEFHSYPGYKDHEYKAFFEEIAEFFEYEFIGFASWHASVKLGKRKQR